MKCGRRWWNDGALTRACDGLSADGARGPGEWRRPLVSSVALAFLRQDQARKTLTRYAELASMDGGTTARLFARLDTLLAHESAKALIGQE